MTGNDHPHSPWTPALDAEVRRMWTAKMTSYEIAAVLGLTRNQVMGRVSRLNLERRGSPIIRNGQKVQLPGHVVNSTPQRKLVPATAGAHYHGPKHESCRFMLNDNPKHPVWCPLKRVAGAPYCSEHILICYKDAG